MNLVRLVPVAPDADFDNNGDIAQRECVLHLRAHQLLDDGEFAFGNLEEEFVVDLQQHHGAEPFGAEPAVDGDHCQLHHIGG